MEVSRTHFNMVKKGSGGHNRKNFKHSKETKEKISKKNKGRLKGIKKSKEFCENLSKKLLGRKITWAN